VPVLGRPKRTETATEAYRVRGVVGACASELAGWIKTPASLPASARRVVAVWEAGTSAAHASCCPPVLCRSVGGGRGTSRARSTWTVRPGSVGTRRPRTAPGDADAGRGSFDLGVADRGNNGSNEPACPTLHRVSISTTAT
jgi:hypothetical protein